MYIFLLFSLFSANVYFFFKKAFLLIFFLLTLYWLLNIFIYLYNVSRSSRQTTPVTRFWRRGLTLFWMIELFLFSTYVYLVLNCAIETEWLAHQGQLFSSLAVLKGSLVFSTTLLFILTVSVIILTKFNVNRSSLQLKTLLLIVLIVTLFLLVEETTQMLNFFTWYHNSTLLFDDEFLAWEFVTAKVPSLVVTQYLSLVILLKYLHAAFVYFLLLTVLRIFIRDSYKNTTTFFKSSVLNLMFLWGFAYIPLVLPLKYLLNDFFTKTYFWFFTNKDSSVISAALDLLF